MAMKEEIPDVLDAVRVLNPPTVTQMLIKSGDNLFYETNGFLADSTLFDIFKYDLLEGNPKRALTLANTVVLSAPLARKLFGNDKAIDKSILISTGGKLREFKVTGVFAKNYNSIIDANFFMSMMSEGWGDWIRGEGANYWAGNNFVPSYVKLVKGHNKALVEKKMNEVLMKHGAEDLKALGMHKTLGLEPVGDIYLKSTIRQSPRITNLYIMAAIAAFILIIACINFMNLSTAKAARRATEIGIRKTIGAYRSSLIFQIFSEAIMIVLFSTALGIVIVQAALPFFNQLTEKNISLNTQNIFYFSAAAFTFAVVTGLLAGSYPALYLSSFQPASVLKGKLNLGNSAGRLRQGLVVFQFWIAIVLVCGLFIIGEQIQFMQNRNLGFDPTAKIVLPIRTDNAHKQYDALQKEIEKLSGVKAVSGAYYLPGSQIFSDMSFFPDGGSMDKTVGIHRNQVDLGYMELLNMKLIAGRNFTNNRASESQSKVIINRMVATKFGIAPDKIVGQGIHFDWQGKRYDFEVIGVMEDYHQNSLHEEIRPTLFAVIDSTKFCDNMLISTSSDKFQATVKSIEEIWKAQVADTPFEYSFLDENIQKLYNEDRRASKIISTFAIVAMIICSLGLYGLSSYMAERRFKEIGIRKVMGASVRQIVTMMSSEFVKLVLIAFVVAVPMAWWAMNKWLETFAFRMEINWLVFAFAGMIALAIALLAVSFESIKSAMGNPVNSLRSE